MDKSDELTLDVTFIFQLDVNWDASGRRKGYDYQGLNILMIESEEF